MNTKKFQLQLDTITHDGLLRTLCTTSWLKTTEQRVKQIRGLCQDIDKLAFLHLENVAGVDMYFPGTLLKSCFLSLRVEDL